MLRAVRDQPADPPAVLPDAAAGSAAGPAPVPAPIAGRRPILTPADYGVPLPGWLRGCIEHVPPGAG
ncbi:MAG: hypothetical protein VKI81_06125, partial [Synechococcaceae cyanobacterium]|nr:hypothetical protein [Synechococcaceae cyanobacterium]